MRYFCVVDTINNALLLTQRLLFYNFPWTSRIKIDSMTMAKDWIFCFCGRNHSMLCTLLILRFSCVEKIFWWAKRTVFVEPFYSVLTTISMKFWNLQLNFMHEDTQARCRVLKSKSFVLFANRVVSDLRCFGPATRSFRHHFIEANTQYWLLG